jgi:hypothetical protein
MQGVAFGSFQGDARDILDNLKSSRRMMQFLSLLFSSSYVGCRE